MAVTNAKGFNPCGGFGETCYFFESPFKKLCEALRLHRCGIGADTVISFICKTGPNFHEHVLRAYGIESLTSTRVPSAAPIC